MSTLYRPMDAPVVIRSRGPQLRDPEPFWVPARYVHADQECSFCHLTIHRAAPGTKSGTRGTKAYYNNLLHEWECIACRQEALRAESARLPERKSEREVA